MVKVVKYYGKGGTILKSNSPAAPTLKTDPLQASIVAWHEAREAARSAKYGVHKMGGGIISKRDNTFVPTGRLFAGHNPGVLYDETKLNNRLRNAYGVNFQKNIATINLPKPDPKTNPKEYKEYLQFKNKILKNKSGMIRTQGQIYKLAKDHSSVDIKLGRSPKELKHAKLKPKASFNSQKLKPYQQKDTYVD